MALLGTSGDDTLIGGVLDDIIYGYAGNDTLEGAEGNDSLYGDTGDDILKGGAGNDTLHGGTGRDHITGDEGDDIVWLSDVNSGDVVDGGEGSDSLTVDLLNGSTAYTIAVSGGGVVVNGVSVGTNFEAFDLRGGRYADTLIGGASNDLLNGYFGQDSLHGGEGHDRLYGGPGSDSLSGGTGNDWLAGGSGVDVLDAGDGDDFVWLDSLEAGDSADGGAGVDELRVDVGWSVASTTMVVLGGSAVVDGTTVGINFEKFQFYGTSGNDTLTGGAGNDTLDGGTGGNDLIDGGAGNDHLKAEGGASQINGGDGDDEVDLWSLSLGAFADGGAGTDRLDLSLAWDAPDTTVIVMGSSILVNGVTVGVNFEAVDFLGGEGDDTLVGGAGDDWLNGEFGNDLLDGKGGDDTLEGDQGDDVFVVDTAGDTVVEYVGEGTDKVRASISYSLGANLENLVLTGTSVLNGYGNALANLVTGNAAANILNGLGGDDRLYGEAGNDKLNGGAGTNWLYGGLGNDTYFVTSGDTVVEGVDAGTDTVRAAHSYKLGANLEALVLTGTSALNGVGNGLANVLVGNGAANLLSGGGGNDRLLSQGGNDRLIGGAGRDKLSGGLGNDAFQFNSLSDGGDAITDFANVAGNNDHFRIDASSFGGGLVAGRTLAASQFIVRDDHLAQDSNDRFIFEKDATKLWYDSNGSASGGLVLVADLQAGASVTAADIWLF